MLRWSRTLMFACGLLAGDCFGGTPLSWKITQTGVGPIQFGMTRSQAQRVSGFVFVDTAEGECIYPVKKGSNTKAIPPVFFLKEGRIVAVEIWDSKLKTLEGAGYGDTESKIRSIYKTRIETVPGDLDGYASLYVWDRDRSSAIRFYSNGADIYMIQVGLAPYITTPIFSCDQVPWVTSFMPPNPAVDPAPFGRWTLRDEAAQRRSP